MYIVSEALSTPAAMTAPQGLRYGTPCAFKGCAGFVHAAGGSTGVVLCSPWGFEDLVMRRSWRLLAEAIAAAGYPCLRFDYPGTGNSLGRSSVIAGASVWIDAIHDAAEMLRLNSGVRRFIFIGQSLGGLLAAEAARTRSDVVALQMIAPVAKGRHHIRELLATSTMVAEQIGIEVELAPEEGLSVVGFGLSRPLVDDLKMLDVTRVPMLPVGDVTIFDSEGRKAGAEISEHFRHIGLQVTTENVAPYHLMISDSTEIQPLPVALDRVVAALRRVAPVSSATPASAPRFPVALVTETFREEPIRFGESEALFGILTRPLVEATAAPAVLLLNRGLNPHIGWRRVSVDHARALAAAGIASLRFDVAGLGESRDEPDRSSNLIYSDLLLPDIRAAVDALVRRGYEQIALAGVCSGAYLALSAAQTDARICSAIVFNPQRFVWNPAERMEDVIRFGLRTMNDYVGDLKRGNVLRKVLRSRRRLAPAMIFLARKATRNTIARLPLRLRSSMLRNSMAARVVGFFDQFAARGTRIAMVFTAGDPGLDELAAYYGKSGRALRHPTISVEVLPSFDHNLTSNEACDVMLDRIISVVCPAPVVETRLEITLPPVIDGLRDICGTRAMHAGAVHTGAAIRT